MKKKWISLFAAIVITGSLFAQGQGKMADEKRQRIESARVAFITSELGLTTDESSKFWALANEKRNEEKALRESMKDKTKGVRKGSLDEFSDAQLKAAMKARLDMKAKHLDIEKKYMDKFIDAVGAKKTAKYYRAEEKFKKELLQRMKQRNRGGRGEFFDGPDRSPGSRAR